MSDERNLREAANRIRHDVARYATLQQRFLPDDPSDADLRDALLADLAATRRGPAGALSVVGVWRALSPEREVLAADPALARVDAGISLIAGALPGLVTAARPELDRVAGLARDLADACRALGPAPR